MTDPDSMEKEWRKFVPVAASGQVRVSIAAALAAAPVKAARGRWSDRCLVSAMGMSAAAAVAIVVLLMTEGRPDAAAPPSANPAMAQLQTREYLAQLAAGKEPAVTAGGPH